MTSERTWPAVRIRPISRADFSSITPVPPSPRRGWRREWSRWGPRPAPRRADPAHGTSPAAAPSAARTRRGGVAQHVTGGHVRHAPLAGELAGLGPLAGAGRSEEGDAHAQLLENAPDRVRDFLRKPS